MAQLALKVDVDTYEGLQNGVPRLLEVFGRRGLNASFFMSFGPDRSGLAAFQLLRPKFFMKMLRTNAPSLYGWRTPLYGTLLPAPLIGCGSPEIVLAVRDAGHEVACHAWDHRLWQDWLFILSEKRIVSWFAKLTSAYRTVLGQAPGAFGAPGWAMDARALKAAKAAGFSYLSCTRAAKPFIFAENGLLEVPSNLPCIEEVGVEGVLAALRQNAASDIPQVLAVHAEVEGGPYAADFERILDTIAELGYAVRRLDEVAASIERSGLEVRGLRRALLPGRAFKCSV